MKLKLKYIDLVIINKQVKFIGYPPFPNSDPMRISMYLCDYSRIIKKIG